jgi:hypothetical protein
MEVAAADERRHPPGRSPAWEESWYLDFVAGDGGLAGYVRLALRPSEGTAWFWAAVVGGGPPLVTLRDHEVPLPSGGGLEVRASGLWTELVCETPLDHWSVGMEAFGVAVDDPLEAWGQERGDPWALGLDVEWEGTAACATWPAGGYWQPCVVHGDVLVGAARFALDGTGMRLHRWGDEPRREPSGWAAGRFEDGTALASTDVEVDCDPSGLLRTVTAGEIAGRAVAAAPVLVPGSGRLARALFRYDAPRPGYGWGEWFHPGAGSGLV